jgi:predicted phage terminase large subunit-like protein
MMKTGHIKTLATKNLQTSSQAFALKKQLLETESESARRDLIAFCKYVSPAYDAARHLLYLREKLKQVERYVETGGKEGIGRLIINLPPRHGKTLTVSKRWPAFLLGRHRKWHIGLIAYGDELAQDFSRASRDLVENSPEYHRLWRKVRLHPSSGAVDRWALADGDADNPNVVAVGINGTLTGRGFEIIVIDDPVKNRAEAESETYRRHLHEAYSGTIRTRLEPGGAIVICCTRWHEDDLPGWLLAEEKSGAGEHWEVVNIPALAEGPDDLLGRALDEPIWPARFPFEALAKLRKANAYEWAAQYQGRPAPLGGGLLKRTFFEIVEPSKVPRGLKVLRYWDLAATEQRGSNDPDWTAGAKEGEMQGVFYILDLVRIKASPSEVEKLIRQTALLDGRGVTIWIEKEGGASGKTVISHYQRNVLMGWAVYGDAPSTSKVVASLGFRAAAERGDVYLVRGPWNEDFLRECESFPTGSHDDSVNAAYGAYNKLTLAPPRIDEGSFEG